MTISLEKVSHRYSKRWVFKDFNYKFKPGIPYVLKGPNGSGKSTILQIAAGMIVPSRGEVQYKDEGQYIDPEDIGIKTSFCAPYMDLFDEFTVKEMIDFHFNLKRPVPDLDFEQQYAHSGLLPHKKTFIKDLSSGLQQRLKLFLSLFSESKALFLDEPASNLDSQGIRWYLDNIKHLFERKIVIIASNDEREHPFSCQLLTIEKH